METALLVRRCLDKMTKTLDKIMYWWAKLGSLVVIGFIIYGIYLCFTSITLYLDIQESRLQLASLGEYMPNYYSFGDLMMVFISMAFAIVFGLVFYSPFLYYGWVKNPKKETNETMKGIAITVSIIWSVILVIAAIFGTNRFSDIIPLLIMLAFMVPIYYYAWGK